MKPKQFIRNTQLRWLLLIGLVAIGILFAQQNVSAKSKSSTKVKTITITKVNQQTAKKVHKQLMRGKKFKIRVKGNTKTFHKKVEKLMDKVAKCTEYRFDFYPIILSEALMDDIAKGYVYCTIRPRDCQEYIYGIKFAKQRHKLFIDYIDQTIPALEGIRGQITSNNQDAQINLVSGFLPQRIRSKETVPQESILTKLDESIVSMRKLSQYLHKTKFYQLSEVMKARMMLSIGSGAWCKTAMSYTLDGYNATFKALYKNKAYGKCADFASVICKICAVFDIGDCDYFHSVAENHAVARVKVKTLSGKTKYSIISNGILDNYNDYTGYKSITRESYRRSHKIDKKIKKINTEKQELKIPFINIKMRTVATGAQITKKGGVTYYFVLPRSEW